MTCLDFALVCDLGVQKMPTVKATKTSKIQSIFQDFAEEFMKGSDNELYFNWCSCTVSCNKCFLYESHRNKSKHEKELSRDLNY